ncbi:MAG: S-adenosylmethionine:tRNA ribosyltransferase-isomerase [Myxococcales bacterium]|nr:S-adenosylmethionine:tRNA ribosyltransferase-isomerase [Myxococcales bacterium]
MIPARSPRSSERVLQIDPATGALSEHTIGDLPSILRQGDLLVVNDAATLPASLRAREPAIEVRLLGQQPDGTFRAVLFDGADWRTPTEHRAPPPPLQAGRVLRFDGLSATIERISPVSSRLVDLRFDETGAALWSAIYRQGRPIQYAYASGPFELWDVQVAYASRPWAAEMPSAGRPLRWEVLLALRSRGVGIASLTHAAGISSTGDPALDAALPLAERFEIPGSTARAVSGARRVVAVGTTVVRALEGAGGRLSGETDLVIGPGYRPRVVDGLLTGVHEKGASHYALLRAFAGEDLLERATAFSEQRGFLSHEFGDSWLIVPSASALR